ncbi:MAG: hypothetical protein RR677_11985 [Acinetobacter sp.]
MENPNKIEIEGIKTIHKLCKFGADHKMEGCSFTEIVERIFDELAKAQAVPKINCSIQAHELTISEIKAEIEEGYDLCQDIHLLDALVEKGIQIGKILAVPEGFVLVRKEHFESLDEFKDLYKRAIINAKKRKDQLNWAHVAGLGVGSGRAVDLCKSLGIDPGATNMHVVIEAQEQSHENG